MSYQFWSGWGTSIACLVVAIVGSAALLIDYTGYRRRHRVDWPHVYEMEREVYGHTFDHAGAPEAPKPSSDGYYHTRRSVPYQNIEKASASHGLYQPHFPLSSLIKISNARTYTLADEMRLRYEMLDTRMSALDIRIRTGTQRGVDVHHLREERASTWREMKEILYGK